MENRYFAYIRKSTDVDDKQELSLEAQKNLITEFAMRENMDLKTIIWFEEKMSAKQPGRPIFDSMIELLKQSKASGLIAHKPDRLARNWIDVGKICDVWDRGLKMMFTTGKLENNSQGKAMFGMQCVMAKWYVDNLSEETKKGQLQSIKNGFFPGQPPLGYLTKKEYLLLSKKETKRREIDPVRAPMIKQAFQLYSEGFHSLEDIVNWAYEQGFRSKETKRKPSGMIKVGAWHGILTNPFYYGSFLWKEKLYKGTHKPIVDFYLWERVQNRLKSSGHNFSVKYDFPLKSYLFKCGTCGKSITAEKKFQLFCSVCKYKFHYPKKIKCPKCKTAIKDMKNLTYYTPSYYHCAGNRSGCREPTITEEDAELQIYEHIHAIQITDKFFNIFKEGLQEGLDNQKKALSEELQNLQRQLGIIKKKYDNLVELYVGQKIDEGIYNNKSPKYQAETTLLQAKIIEIKQNKNSWYKTAVRYLELAREASKLYMKADINQKRKLISTIFQNLKLKDKKIIPTFHKPFDILISAKLDTPKLENRNSNITTQLACIFKTFEDFRLVQQIREEIEKVKPSLALAT